MKSFYTKSNTQIPLNTDLVFIYLFIFSLAAFFFAIVYDGFFPMFVTTSIIQVSDLKSR